MFSAVALFCEDIREEVSGMSTLIGIYPDNVHVGALPFIFPKLSVFMRLNMTISSAPPNNVEYWLTSPDQIPFPRSVIDKEIIKRAYKEAREKGGTNAGTISKATMNLLQIRSEGRLNLMVSVDGLEIVAGTLNVQVGKKPGS